MKLDSLDQLVSKDSQAKQASQVIRVQEEMWVQSEIQEIKVKMVNQELKVSEETRAVLDHQARMEFWAGQDH